MQEERGGAWCGAETGARGGSDRFDQYCTRFGCFAGVTRDDFENPWPSLAWSGGAVSALYLDPRIPSSVVGAFCGPAGCAGASPLFPAGALVSRGCLSCDASKVGPCSRQ